MVERDTRPVILSSPRIAGEQQPSIGREFGDAQVILKQEPHELYELTYACLLIPRFPSHLIKGDLAEELPRWLGQICVSFGWLLEDLNIHPERLQWIMTVQQSTSSADFMRTIRTRSSKLIFENYPALNRENLSTDFWAPGYLVIVSRHFHPPEMVEEFIRTTRQHQGILRRRS